jgi:hypothetical protein
MMMIRDYFIGSFMAACGGCAIPHLVEYKIMVIAVRCLTALIWNKQV